MISELADHGIWGLRNLLKEWPDIDGEEEK
jgi:hypothetical protein